MFMASHLQHGSLANGLDLPAPQIVTHCEKEARPGYETCLAHEYCDTDEALATKISLLADMIQRSTNCVAYTGAGISTSAGINDYATQSLQNPEASMTQTSWLDAEPTLCHQVLRALHAEGLLKHWIQQNHDGLPQKCGFPQHQLNEIHGGWYDPTNIVVGFGEQLRPDLIQWLREWEDKADLCLALGTSLAGMNADRIATTTAQRASSGQAVGTVIISIQETQLDDQCQLKIYAPMELAMDLLAKEIGLTDAAASPCPLLGAQFDTFHQLPYDMDGVLDPSASSTLDLRPGAYVRIRMWQTNQWIEKVGELWGTDKHGHYEIGVRDPNGHQDKLMLGAWFLKEAVDGKLPKLPLVNCLPPSYADEPAAGFQEELLWTARRKALLKHGVSVTVSPAADGQISCAVSLPDRSLEIGRCICQVEIGDGTCTSKLVDPPYRVELEDVSAKELQVTVQWSIATKLKKSVVIVHPITYDMDLSLTVVKQTYHVKNGSAM